MRRSDCGTMTTAAAAIHRPTDTELLYSTDTSPSVMDSARRRFCSIMFPRTTPNTSGAIGTSNLRRKYTIVPIPTTINQSNGPDLIEYTPMQLMQIGNTYRREKGCPDCA